MIYEYQCESCSKVIELQQKIADPPLEKCPSCNGRVKRLISLTNSYTGKKDWKSTDTGPRRY